jgi:hypothetical protein
MGGGDIESIASASVYWWLFITDTGSFVAIMSNSVINCSKKGVEIKNSSTGFVYSWVAAEYVFSVMNLMLSELLPKSVGLP